VAIGTIVGGLVDRFFGLPGILHRTFVGAVVGELTARRELRQAGRAGIGATLGLVLGGALKLALALAMIGLFLLARSAWGGS
jgi:uncharacterized protein YqgC (DUF456 family)